MMRGSKNEKSENDSHEAVCSGLGSDAGFWYYSRVTYDVKQLGVRQSLTFGSKGMY
jgi:hypothetical protein